MNRLDKEEMIEFLKENLQVRVSIVQESFSGPNIQTEVILGGEVIYEYKDWVNPDAFSPTRYY